MENNALMFELILFLSFVVRASAKPFNNDNVHIEKNDTDDPLAYFRQYPATMHSCPSRSGQQELCNSTTHFCDVTLPGCVHCSELCPLDRLAEEAVSMYCNQSCRGKTVTVA